MVRPTVHTIPSHKTVRAFENVLQTGGIRNRWVYVFVRMENILKTELSRSENDGFMMFM